MAESGLSLTYGQLKSAVAYKLGYSRSSTNWSDDEQETIDWVVLQGLRNFYFPPPLPGQGHIHEWSFLRAIRTVESVEGQVEYQLPDDFGGLEGPLTISGSGGSYRTLSVVSDGWIRTRQSANPSVTGIPTAGAVVPRPATPGASFGQRWDLWLYPTPQAAYSVSFRQRVAPTIPSDDNAMPYGGAAHAQTIMVFCLAEAEKSVNDQSGVHAQDSLIRLAASITHDRGLGPEQLGYNGDGPTDEGCGRPHRPMTYRGIMPDDY